MPLGTYQEAVKSKDLSGFLAGEEYEMVEYYGSGLYCLRRKRRKEP